jgi:hypothetical protein
MSKATHYVTLQLTSGEVFTKCYLNTSEGDIALELGDYKRGSEKYGIKVIAVAHQDNSKCPEFAVA